jgi:hypothetical protein
MHLHWFREVEHDRHGNSYRECRCGKRKIHHRVRNVPLNYRWLEGGPLHSRTRPRPPQGPGPVVAEPTVGPGPSGVGSANARALHRADEPQTSMLQQQRRLPPVPPPKGR